MTLLPTHDRVQNWIQAPDLSGREYFEHYATSNGCEIVVANQQSLSPEQEMIEDLLSIVHSFSSCWYGLRKYNKILKEELKK